MCARSSASRRPAPPRAPSATAGRSTDSERRRGAQLAARRARGKRAEDAVADFLFARGFEIVARNVRIGALELDLVGRKGTLAVLVEVRTRGPGSFARGLASIDAKKRATLTRAAESYWLQTLSKMPGIERVRIDVAAVTFDAQEARVEYIESALTA